MTAKTLFARPRRTLVRGSGSTQTTPTPYGPPLKGGPRVGGVGINHEERNNKTQVDTLLEQTAGMTLIEKKRLLDQLAMEVQHGSADKKKNGRDIEMWSGSVHTALAKVTGDASGIMLVKKVMSPAAVWNPVEEFMQTSGFSTCTVIERQGVYNLLAGLLVDHALKISRFKGNVLSPKFVANCSSSIAGIFEASFPG